MHNTALYPTALYATSWGVPAMNVSAGGRAASIELTEMNTWGSEPVKQDDRAQTIPGEHARLNTGSKGCSRMVPSAFPVPPAIALRVDGP
jgi:hypothetical protein